MVFSTDIRRTAQALNANMFELISSKEEKDKAFTYLDLDSVMKVLQQYLIQGSVDTKVAVLQWIHHLFTQNENEVVSITIILKYEVVISASLILDLRACDKPLSSII